MMMIKIKRRRRRKIKNNKTCISDLHEEVRRVINLIVSWNIWNELMRL